MQFKIVPPLAAKIFGILVTLLILAAFGPKMFSSLEIIRKIPAGTLDWHDNPTGFVILYLLGYLILWWKVRPGAYLILASGLLYLVLNPSNIMFTAVFILPTLLVATLYLLSKTSKT